MIVTFGTKCFVRYSWHVRYLGCSLLGGFAEVGMRNFQGSFETPKRSFISAFLICMIVCLKHLRNLKESAHAGLSFQ